jgi:hypothetical protein
MGLWKCFVAWLTRPDKPRQTTFLYCPGCQHELVAGGHFFGEDPETRDWIYNCAQCNQRSSWDTVSFPIPVLRRAKL